MARPRSRLTALGLLASLGLALVRPAGTVAVAPDWTVSGAPLAVVYGTPSTVNVTITGGTTPIGCIEVALANPDTADASTILVQPSGSSWTSAISTGNRDVVVLTAAGSADRLTPGAVLTVEIQVTSVGQNAETWKVTGHQGETTSSSTSGIGSKSITSIVVTGGPKPTPRATPTPTPTAIPTPTSTSTPTASPSPAPSPTRTPTPSPSPSTSLGATPAPPGHSSGGQGASSGAGQLPTGSPSPDAPGIGLTIPDDGRPGTGSSSGVAPIISLGNVAFGSSFRWLVPTFALSVPGLLIVGAVVIQLLTGLTFVELTRRWMGQVLHRRRRRARSSDS